MKTILSLFFQMLFFALVFSGFGYLMGSEHSNAAKNKEIRQIKTDILRCEHAPGFVTIQDTAYLIRYYSFETEPSYPKTN